MIVDCHAHMASPRVLPRRFFAGWLASLKRSLPYDLAPEQETRLDEMLAQLAEDPGCAALRQQMDAAGIGRAVLLVIDFGLVFDDLEADLEELHLEHRRLVESDPRFVAFAGVDPRRGAEGLDLFERAVAEWGFRGLKLYPPCGYSPSDRRLFPFYEVCAARGLPVLIHTGPTSSVLPFTPAHPMNVDEAAHAFPGVDFILGHGAVVYAYEAALLAEYRPNIYLDLSGFQVEHGRGLFRNLLRGHLARGLGRKLLFGTDWPIHRFWGPQSKWVEVLRAFQTEGLIAEADLERILGGTMTRLLARAGAAAPAAPERRTG